MTANDVIPSVNAGSRPYLDADGGAIEQLTPPHSPLPAAASGAHDTVALTVTRPGRHGSRTVGVYERTPRGLQWRPAVDVQRLAERGQAVAALAVFAAAAGWTARGWAQGRPAVGRVTMGPGGWISVRVPRRRSGRRDIQPHAAGRPWWARVLHADRLIVQPSARG